MSSNLRLSSLPCSDNLDSSPGGDNSGDEDCLSLSVYSPQNATNLPILVWIRKLLILQLVFFKGLCCFIKFYHRDKFSASVVCSMN